jgi:hypothetical protein
MGCQMTSALRATIAVLGGSVMAVGAAALSTAAPASAQQAVHATPVVPERVVLARRITTAPPQIDGRLDDEAWAQAAVADGFTQFRPWPGRPASQNTEARVLFDHEAIYVSLRAYDDQPGEIVGHLTRRGEDSDSDWLGVMIDSNADRRTAYQFGVNAAGVRRDVLRIADTEEDPAWDPVWEAAVQVDERGWTAEFRIPFSQLRFGAAAERWGVNFFRVLAREDEISLWAPTSPDDGAVVSRFGWLAGLRDLPTTRRIEVMPYALARLRGAGPSGRTGGRSGGVGADVKAGVTSEITVDLTVNPDFGQIDADPARLNLTAFETSYPERRPFFLEAADLFDLRLGFSDDERATLFYSRRIGRQPHGSPGAGGPASPLGETTILAAAKLSGRTAGGWSLGLLEAVTAEETTDAGYVMEPLTSYSVVRMERALGQNRTSLGFAGTMVQRDRSAAAELLLPHGAYVGGADFRHRFADRYQLTGLAAASLLVGSGPALAAVQRSSTHYFQRPDATHLDLDPDRRDLAGATVRVRMDKLAGAWRGAAGYEMRTPGLDVNDLGYQRYADYHHAFVEVGHQRNEPRGNLQSWALYSAAWSTSTHGGERIERVGNVRGEARLRSQWGGWVGVEHDRGGFSPWELRGGPLLRREPETQVWGGVYSDGRRRLQGQIRAYVMARPASDSRATEASVYLSWRPVPRLRLAAGPRYGDRIEDQQWLGATANDPPSYVFGRLQQRTLAMTTRLELAFTPSFTLQLYAEPFLSAGRVTRFQRVADATATARTERFTQIDVVRVDGDRYEADLDGDGVVERFASPDFGYRQFRSNAVLRWEYRPGSTLYIAWSQGRDARTGLGDFDPWRHARSLFSVRPDNVLMAKVSYWMSP